MESGKRNTIPALETCLLHNQPPMGSTGEYHSRKHLLHCTGGLKGIINAAEAEVANCWVFILEQPSGMYQPSFSGVAKEYGKGRGKALISRSDILS